MSVLELTGTSGEDRSRTRVRRAQPRAADWNRRIRWMTVPVDVAGSLAAGAVWLLAGGTPGWSIVVALSWMAVLAVAQTYDDAVLSHGIEEFERVLKAGIGGLVVLSLLNFLAHVTVPRMAAVGAMAAATVTCLLGRFAVRKYIHRARAAGRYLKRVLVVGEPGPSIALAEELRRDPYHGYAVVSVLHVQRDALLPVQRREIEPALGVPVLGGVADVVPAVRESRADVVAVISSPELSGSTLRELSWALERTSAELVVAPGIIEVAGPRLHIRPIAELPLLHVDEPKFSGGVRAAKAVIDRLGAAFGLLLLSPVLLAISLGIKLRGGEGPVLFRQTRIGLHGAPFEILKFRTMVDGAERQRDMLLELNEAAGLLFKVRDDPRITPLGRLLRRFSLDELPQLWNVLRGQMSLVGPRPPLPEEVALYSDDMRRRLLVKPGLTGLWQVSGRSDLSWEETVRLDLRYVENWSMGLDAFILYKTASAVLRRSGAY